NATGDRLVYAEGATVIIERWKNQGGVRTIPGDRFAFSPRGDSLAVGRADGSVQLFHCDTWTPKGPPSGRGEPVAALAFNPDGIHVAIARGNAVWIWDSVTGREDKRHTHDNYVFCVAYSHDGRLLASSDRNGEIQVRNAASGAEVMRPPPQGEAVHSVAFSVD